MHKMLSKSAICIISDFYYWSFQCFRHSDLHNGRPSTTQFKEKLPWFLEALPSSDCAKGGHGAYTSSVELKGLGNGYCAL